MAREIEQSVFSPNARFPYGSINDSPSITSLNNYTDGAGCAVSLVDPVAPEPVLPFDFVPAFFGPVLEPVGLGPAPANFFAAGFCCVAFLAIGLLAAGRAPAVLVTGFPLGVAAAVFESGLSGLAGGLAASGLARDAMAGGSGPALLLGASNAGFGGATGTTPAPLVLRTPLVGAGATSWILDSTNTRNSSMLNSYWSISLSTLLPNSCSLRYSLVSVTAVLRAISLSIFAVSKLASVVFNFIFTSQHVLVLSVYIYGSR